MTRLAPPADRRASLEARFTPWAPLTLHGALDRAVEDFADRPLLLTDDRAYSYAQVQEWSRALAAGLVELGVRPGDHVALLMANHPEFAAAKFAISRAGATCIPVNYLFRAAELGYVLEQSRATVLLAMDRYRDLAYLEALDAIAPGWESGGGSALPDLRQVVVFSPSGDDRPGAMTFAQLESLGGPASREELTRREAAADVQAYSDILYTSGTTGRPKGVLLKHDQVVREAYAAAYQRALEDGRRMVFPLPMYHVFGYIECLVPVLFVGGAVIPQVVFDAPAMLRSIAQHGAHELVAVPAVTLPLMEEHRRGGYDVSSIHTVFSSGGMAPPTIWDDIAEVFGNPDVVTGYGMTETTASTTCTDPEDDEVLVRTTNGHLRAGGAAGDPELGGKVAVYRVVDPVTGDEVEPGQQGHLLARGMVVTDGYYDKPEETALAFTDDGWLRTGDLGSIDAEGNLRLTGRLKESFRVGGEMVMPREIELVLGEHPGVAEAHVAGIPHDRMGEVAAAWVVCRDPDDRPDPDELVAHCAGLLARYKVPRHIFFTTLAELPLTATGRVQKFRLTQLAERSLVPGPRPAPAGPVERHPMQDAEVTGNGAPPVNGTITRDTPVGHELVGVKKKAAIQLMGSRLWGRFNPNHWDPVYAAQTGLPAPIQTGEMSSAYLSEMCVNHFGRNFFTGSRMECKYVSSTLANEVITTYGVVRDKTPKGDGFRFGVEIWAENEDGEKKTVGRVEVDVDV